MRKLESKAQSKISQDLYQAILKLENVDECSRFFRDLLTLEEIDEIARRWQVAQMIIKEVPYSDIEKQTGMSSVTISRIAYWLHHGMNGYKLMLTRLDLSKEK